MMDSQPVVFSVPHSGTIFSIKFLEYLGFKPSYIHSDELGVRRLRKLPDSIDIIIPIRHPYHVCLTHFQRNDGLRRLGFDAILDRVCNYYERFIYEIDRRTCIALRVDCVEAKKQPTAIAIAAHLKADTEKAVEWASKWSVINWSPHEYPIPDYGWSKLDTFLERFGYLPEDMTKFKQVQGSEQTQKQKMRFVKEVTLPKPEIKGKGVIIRAEDKTNGVNSIDGGS